MAPLEFFCFSIPPDLKTVFIVFVENLLLQIVRDHCNRKKEDDYGGKPNDLPPEQCLAVDTDTLCKLLCCGRHTAVQIGDLANARITMNTRVLWSVQRIKEYLYDISG